LPQETDSSGNAILECTQFADGYSWGPIKSANLQIAGETANALPIQVIGDPAYSNNVPQSCTSGTPTSENTVATFGANGVIGVGPFAQDCGEGCAQSAISAWYYACSGGSCQSIAVSLAQQVPNPITFFAADNNGVIISLPTVNGGATTVTGSMIFGVGTQSNNALGNQQVYAIDPNTGDFTTKYKNVSLTTSFLDSGSNALYFNDSSISQCSDGSGFYCPTSTLSLSAVNTGVNGISGTVNFLVGSENNIPSSYAAYSLLAGTGIDNNTFDWGLPFFFGRNIYTVIQGQVTSGGVGPYWAY